VTAVLTCGRLKGMQIEKRTKRDDTSVRVQKRVETFFSKLMVVGGVLLAGYIVGFLLALMVVAAVVVWAFRILFR
jgi:hypothetical protein